MENIKLRRIIALHIDIVVIIIIAQLVTQIITLNKVNLDASPILIIVGVVIYFGLTLFFAISKDTLFGNASLGKKILGIAVYSKDGNIPDKKILRKRISNSLLLFPLDILYILLYNKTSGDEKYNTTVDFIKK